MWNGRVVTLLRIAASAIIGLVALLGAAVLLANGVEIPSEWWIIAGLAVASVAGADVVTSFLNSKERRTSDDTRN